VYFTLAAAREKAGINDLAIVRIEQPYPFPTRELTNIFEKYRNAREICWIQEETRNRGCWSFMEPRLRELLPAGSTLCYIGRKEAASPATGSHKMHEDEEKEIVTQALGLKNGAPATAGVLATATTSPATEKSPTAVSQ
jgi:2-oxoglutarate dehydrogenase complex dehydrogenase (E1) component-like enzyme